MKRLPSFRMSLFAQLSGAALIAVTACGGISDPSDNADRTVATVRGALTGANVPANTRVALVWRVGDSSAYAVTGDVAVTNGSFTMNLATPSDSYFFEAGESSNDGTLPGAAKTPSSGGSTPPDGTEEETPPSKGATDAGFDNALPPKAPSQKAKGFAFASTLAPRDTVSGQISKPLNVAVAGFVVYVDTNGNGKLDISGEYAASTDEVIGGNKELMLAYLRDGGTLDYEKLRDSSSILPKAGYNLMWTDEERWLPLNAVDLKITSNTKLPSAVCAASEQPDVTGEEFIPTKSDAGAPYGLQCSADGRSYSINYGDCNTTPAPAPTPAVGLCAPYYGDYGGPSSYGCGSGGINSLPPGDPVPEGWPCAVTVADGGVDAGPSDAGADALPPDEDGGAGQ